MSIADFFHSQEIYISQEIQQFSFNVDKQKAMLSENPLQKYSHLFVYTKMNPGLLVV